MLNSAPLLVDRLSENSDVPAVLWGARSVGKPPRTRAPTFVAMLVGVNRMPMKVALAGVCSGGGRAVLEV